MPEIKVLHHPFCMQGLVFLRTIAIIANQARLALPICLHVPESAPISFRKSRHASRAVSWARLVATMVTRVASSADASCSYSTHQPAARHISFRSSLSHSGLQKDTAVPKRREVGQRCSSNGQAEKFWSVAEILQEVSELVLQLFCLAHAPPLSKGLCKTYSVVLRRGRKGRTL